MKPFPVVHIITKLELGGAQQNTLFTIAHLNRERFQPYLITNNEGILVSEAMALKGVTTFLLTELIREINPLMDIRALFKIRDILRSLKKSDSAVIVHTHSSKAGILGRWAARFAGADVILHTFHGFGFHDFQTSPVRHFLIFLEKLTALITDKLITVSKANIHKGVKAGIFPRKKTVLIRSGIEMEEFTGIKVKKAQKKKELGVARNLPLATMIGCLKPQKAPLDYVEVIGRGSPLSKPPLEYFKRFYADTVLSGSTPGLMCGYAFFGPDHMLFASDYPYPGGAEKGDLALAKEIRAVEMMDVPDEEKNKIFWENAEQILNLSS